MFSGWLNSILAGITTLNQILTAGIAITAFSLLIYALTFNLRDRVARSFAIIMASVVVIFTTEAIQSSVRTLDLVELFLRLQWLGIIFLPPAYLHLSDALLVTAGRPSRWRRRWAVRIIYLVSIGFTLIWMMGGLVGTLVINQSPAPYLQRTTWTEIFTVYYLVIMLLAGINFIRAYQRMLTRSGRRRMLYLMAGATAPALGSYPYLLFGSSIAVEYPLLFWILAATVNFGVGALIVTMAYAVAFFGVSWPDRVVKSRLFKWIMRGPVTASITLAVMTIVRRAGEMFGVEYNAAVPVLTVATILLLQHLITLIAPIWERTLFFGRDRAELTLLQNIEERLLTQTDLRQFLESILAAVRDHMQSSSAFIAALDGEKLSLLISAGRPFSESETFHRPSNCLKTTADDVSTCGTTPGFCPCASAATPTWTWTKKPPCSACSAWRARTTKRLKPTNSAPYGGWPNAPPWPWKTACYSSASSAAWKTSNPRPSCYSGCAPSAATTPRPTCSPRKSPSRPTWPIGCAKPSTTTGAAPN
jgi:hypothetical protein